MLEEILACPRCDKTPLAANDGAYRCDACKVDFPSIDGIPWLFAEPQATLGKWRGRLQFAQKFTDPRCILFRDKIPDETVGGNERQSRPIPGGTKRSYPGVELLRRNFIAQAIDTLLPK